MNLLEAARLFTGEYASGRTPARQNLANPDRRRLFNAGARTAFEMWRDAGVKRLPDMYLSPAQNPKIDNTIAASLQGAEQAYAPEADGINTWAEDLALFQQLLSPGMAHIVAQASSGVIEENVRVVTNPTRYGGGYYTLKEGQNTGWMRPVMIYEHTHYSLFNASMRLSWQPPHRNGSSFPIEIYDSGGVLRYSDLIVTPENIDGWVVLDAYFQWNMHEYNGNRIIPKIGLNHPNLKIDYYGIMMPPAEWPYNVNLAHINGGGGPAAAGK